MSGQTGAIVIDRGLGQCNDNPIKLNISKTKVLEVDCSILNMDVAEINTVSKGSSLEKIIVTYSVSEKCDAWSKSSLPFLSYGVE